MAVPPRRPRPGRRPAPAVANGERPRGSRDAAPSRRNRSNGASAMDVGAKRRAAFALLAMANDAGRFIWRGAESPTPTFPHRLLYRLVRHPLMLGFLIAFWAAPTMTAGHLLFAIGMTANILIAVSGREERDRRRHWATNTGDYRCDVPMLLPRPRGTRPKRLASTNSREAWRCAPAWRACRPAVRWESTRW